LADEVGLGKTLEAISLINFSLKFGDVRRILLVTPPNLMLQWQEELFTSLGIDFLRWESGTGHYVNHRKEVSRLAGQSQPLGANSPNFVLISNAKFRDRSFLPFLEDKHRVLPDLLIVDEAHAARVSIDANSGKRKETLLWKRLDYLAKKVDNLLLLTATPMQVHPIEFFELLKLIGLPQGWDTYSVFEKSLSWIASGSKAPSLPEASHFAQLLPSLVRSFGKEALSRFPELRPAVNEFTKETDEFKKASLVRNNWTDFRKLLTLLHPASQLVVRNTRTGLEPLGYKFPDRDFAAPDLNISDAIHSFHDDLSKYLSDGFGITEEAQWNSKSGRSAFQKSRWWERTASSLHAALISTSNRIAKLEDAAEGKLLEITNDEWEEPVQTANQNLSSPKHRENVRQTALKEISYLSALKAKAEAILEESGGLEPKFLATRDIVSDAISAKSPILVFSKFVHTLEGCIDFLAPTLQNAGISYGLYTGKTRRLFRDGEELDVSKQTIVNALNDGELGVIFCSEAASEGLNLQSANRLLNIDVPWNPAKLEQRIGRIARLGQKAETVQITNLWYPGSIEGRMYGRLLARKDLFALAVGEMPDLFSDAIESAIGMNLDPAATAVSASSSLEKFRDEIQRKALREVWNQNLETSQASTQFRADLLELLRQRGEFPKSYVEDQVNPGSKKPLTLRDLRDVSPRDLGETGYGIVAISYAAEITSGFACQSPSGTFRLLKPEKVIRWMLQEDKEDSSLYDSGWIAEDEIASALNAILPSQRWLPASARDLLQQRLGSSKAFEVLSIKEVA
jgi:superfamily II DNA/RNA helicase